MHVENIDIYRIIQYPVNVQINIQYLGMHVVGLAGKGDMGDG